MIYALVIASAVALSASPDSNESIASNLTAYKEAKASVGRDADAHVRLALWCEAHGMNAERTKHLTIATLIDPQHATARGLLGMVQYKGKWLSPDAIAEQLLADPEQQARVKEYLQRRVKAADKPDDQVKLALWCEENGLKDQATAHFYRAAQLDPSREIAWKHLGYKKEKGRWMKPEQLAAEKEMFELQAKANKHWKPILEKLRHGLASKHQAERDKAQVALNEIKDPAAVPMIWLTFAQGDERKQEVAVKLFGQIDGPGSSKALAILAIMSPSNDVRRSAVERLKRKDPRDFADILIAMIRKPIEYEVRHKVGVDGPGELFIKGTDRNWRRIFNPMAMPNIQIWQNDQIYYDQEGMPVIQRWLNPGAMSMMGLGSSMYRSFSFSPNSANAGQISSALNQAGIPASNAAQIGQSIANGVNNPVNQLFTVMNLDPMGLYGLNPYPRLDIPVGQIVRDVQNSAVAAQSQLDDEVKQLEDYNRPIRDINRNARQLLKDSTGVDFGDDPAKWENWFVDMLGLAVKVSATREIPTAVEEATIDFQPSVDPRIVNLATVREHTGSCFAAGTMVRTFDGLQTIETLKAGDLVLTQNVRTGQITFSPVLNPVHNPPNATFKIHFEGPDKPVVATGIHRFWRVGEGWAMARDLKAGDTLRAIGGVAKVASIEADATQPVFNLRVAEGESFFVGDLGILAHDNSLVNPTDKPFDRAEIKVLASAGRK